MTSAGTRPSVRETRVLDGDDIRRAVTRIAHEITERNQNLDEVVIIGIQAGGVWIADAVRAAVEQIHGGSPVAHGAIDVSMYRDDISLRPVMPSAPTHIPRDLTGATVILVDEVLYTGRTVRAALEALNDHGRPRAVQLAVIVDRGHRQLPIRPDYVGKNIPTHLDDEVTVGADGVTVTTRAEAGE